MYKLSRDRAVVFGERKPPVGRLCREHICPDECIPSRYVELSVRFEVRSILHPAKCVLGSRIVYSRRLYLWSIGEIYFECQKHSLHDEHYVTGFFVLYLFAGQKPRGEGFGIQSVDCIEVARRKMLPSL